jgi:hypothetical protein
MRRLMVPLTAVLVAGTVGLAATAAARSEPTCTVQDAGGVSSSSALGRWTYEVGLRCPFALHSFSLQTNKDLLSGVDRFKTRVPYAYANLKSGKQANFTCKLTSKKAVQCTVSPALPAHIVIVDGFDSSTACKNTKKGQFQATLTVNGRATKVSYIIDKKTSSQVTGGCG